jgi:RimJ/RimL family protein N-acetyltransferase
MNQSSDFFEFDGDSFLLMANLVPWDSKVFQHRVAAISQFVLKSKDAGVDLTQFKLWVATNKYKVVSCRLPHDKLWESICLEDNGFRFIEMVLHPVALGLHRFPPPTNRLLVKKTSQEDLPIIERIATTAFGFERYHVDPRIDSKLADVRYGQWALNSFWDDNQHLVKIITEDRAIVGFFLFEEKVDKSVHWNLTALDKVYQGCGLGYQTWLAMIDYHRSYGIDKISTTISARNYPVLNLYSKLSFKFEPPEMTFHWVVK